MALPSFKTQEYPGYFNKLDINLVSPEYYQNTSFGQAYETQRANERDRDMTKDATRDKELIINSLEDVDKYLRSFNDQRWTRVEKQTRNRMDDLHLKCSAFLY